MEQVVRFCTAPDVVRIAYAVHRSGAPLVKVANWLTHLEHDWENLIWDHWLAELGRRFTVVRYDERCCGLSDLQRRSCSAENAVRLMEAWARVDTSCRISLVRTPAVVCHARGDEAVPFEEGRFIATGLQGGKLVPLEGRNHLYDEIAARLFLSARTVERHLSNVYVKWRLGGNAARAAAATRLSQLTSSSRST